MDLTGAWRETTLTAAAKMIVLCPDNDVLVFQQRIGAFEHADNVVGRDFTANDIAGECDLASQESVGARRFCDGGLFDL